MKYTRVVIIAMLTFTIHKLKHIKFAVCEILLNEKQQILRCRSHSNIKYQNRNQRQNRYPLHTNA